MALGGKYSVWWSTVVMMRSKLQSSVEVRIANWFISSEKMTDKNNDRFQTVFSHTIHEMPCCLFHIRFCHYVRYWQSFKKEYMDVIRNTFHHLQFNPFYDCSYKEKKKWYSNNQTFIHHTNIMAFFICFFIAFAHEFDDPIKWAIRITENMHEMESISIRAAPT